MDRNTLLRHIQMCEFILTEVTLYLDTHKNDKEALAFFNKHKEMLLKYKNEYTTKYGALTILDNNETWNWVDTKWPWELN
ncbi:MAG: spore coat protein CotJB [Oscillospiraceae bacterium]